MKRLILWLIPSLFALVMELAQAAEGVGPGMIMMGSGMMAACIVFGLLILTVLFLTILALIKYLRSAK
jgi:hypothetical protein